jgi:hypothetical protein
MMQARAAAATRIQANFRGYQVRLKWRSAAPMFTLYSEESEEIKYLKHVEVDDAARERAPTPAGIVVAHEDTRFVFEYLADAARIPEDVQPNAHTSRKGAEAAEGHADSATNRYNEGEAVEALRNYQGCSTAFRGFDVIQLSRLVGYFTFHSLSAGELVLVKGECATFIGLLLWGEIDIMLSEGSLGHTLLQGSIIGESHLFTGGDRAADAKAAARGCVVATISFAEMTRLRTELPMLGLKLSQVFGACFFNKMRSKLVLQQPPSDTFDGLDGIFPLTGDVLPHLRAAQVATAAFGVGHGDHQLVQLAEWLTVWSVVGASTVLKKGWRCDSIVFVLSGRLRASEELDGKPPKEYGTGAIIGANSVIIAHGDLRMALHSVTLKALASDNSGEKVPPLDSLLTPS